MSTSGRSDPEPPEGTANSLEQVREILFGTHQRDTLRRLARLDAHVGTKADELRNETQRRLDLLEAHVRKETEAVAAMIESTRTSLFDLLQGVSRESKEECAVLEQRLKKLEDGVGRAQQDFRQQILNQAKGFIDEERRTREELRAAFDRELATVRGQPDEPEVAAASDEPTPSEEGGRRHAA